MLPKQVLSLLMMIFSVALMTIGVLTDSWSSGQTVIKAIKGDVNWGLWNQCWGISFGSLGLGKCKKIEVPKNKKNILLTCRVLSLTAIGLTILAGMIATFSINRTVLPLIVYLVAAGCTITTLTLWSSNLFQIDGYKLGAGYSYVLFLLGAIVSLVSILPLIIS